MKKILAIILVVALMLGTFAIAASAANFENLAEELYELELFRGTEAGFDLDRAPTRAQALVMLLRLLGLEEQAQTSEYENPFEDMAGHWAVSYAAFAYEHGLTTGTSANNFSPNALASAQMYVTFVLRALGYNDQAGDFTFANALAFGTTVGVFSDLLDTGEFLRDHMVAVSYLALVAEPVGGEFPTLLEQLIADGAVDATAAEVVLRKVDLFEEYMVLSEALAALTRFALAGTMTLDATVAGQREVVDMDMEMSIIIDGNDMQMASVMQVTDAGEEMTIYQYVVGGYIYTDADGMRFRMPVEYNMDQLLAMENMFQVDFEVNLVTLILGTDIGRGADGALVITYRAGFMDDMMRQLLTMMGPDALGLDDSMDFSFGDMVYRLYTDADGALTRMAMFMDMTMTMEVEGAVVSIALRLSFDFEITATGTDVVIEFPDDLDEWPLLEDLEEAEEDAANGEEDEDDDEEAVG